ncbi:MAG: hypothetical protein VKP70_04100 [Cyanobacteriota bacterium]|nr:hypothetical protein [Cyanobacteriota bacterium]
MPSDVQGLGGMGVCGWGGSGFGVGGGVGRVACAIGDVMGDATLIASMVPLP